MSDHGRMKTWMCITKCQWGTDPKNYKIYDVGETVAAYVQPCKHFIEVESNTVVDPVKVIRRELEDLNVVWDKDWSLQRLQRELLKAKEFMAKAEEGHDEPKKKGR